MTSFQLYKELSEIDPELLADAENCLCETRTPRRIHRPLLIAALIALMLFLMGCAVVYVLRLESVTIASGTAERDHSLVNGVYVEDPHTVSITTLTLAGLEGSNAYRACTDFYAFDSEYIANGEQMTLEGALPKNYWGAYLDIMNTKASELAAHYNLKPEGKALDFRTTRNLCDALGVERFTHTGSEIRSAVIGGWCYDTGNFRLDMNFTFPEDQGYEVLNTPGILRWNRQDSFSRDYVTRIESGDWIERNYTTAAGSNVLILQSPTQELGYIFCDRDEALMSLQLNVNVELLSEEGGVVSAEYRQMTDRQIEMVADTIDFAIQPRIPTQADVDAQAGISQEATQNGYTLRLKSAVSDGYVLRVLLGVEAPEGMALPTSGHLIFANFNGELLSPEGSPLLGGGSITAVDDGDEKENTADLHVLFSYVIPYEDAPFALGDTWNLHLVDIVHSDWSVETGLIQDTLAEGEWLFPITFDEMTLNSQEIELLPSPITAKASTGWLMDGTDVMEAFQISSIRLRSQSIRLTSDASTGADFFYHSGTSSYVVMKDGSRVNILNQDFMDPIDLDQADHILLADGTVIPVPKV